MTSQLFANIYLNELDQFVKHKFKIKYYIRYCDDFVILGENRNDLFLMAERINGFFKESLNLSLHSDKIIIKKYKQGIDFLGYVVLPYHRVLRTRTERRIFRKINKNNNQSVQSYLGVLKHCNSYEVKKKLLKIL
ncbi:MAG: RNA-directed DNA polymerase [Patescibacteria group bacterium]